MIIAIFGTTGELIKLAPVLRRLDDRGLSYLTISTNQQVTQIPIFQSDLGLRPTDIELARGRKGRDLELRPDIPAWAAAVSAGFLRARGPILKRLRDAPERHVAVVHGDTMTTVLGAMMGRLLRLPVAHLEAGMRSGDWRNPFPEELNRRTVGRLARIHYAPTHVETENLRDARGDIIQIGANTVLDALAMVPPGRASIRQALGKDAPTGRYGLISLHRSELLSDRARLAEILRAIRAAKVPFPMFFVDHPVTVAAVRGHGLDEQLNGIVRIPRLCYTSFIALLRDCEFLLTDSGGCQEECFYLDVPCLVHRLVTERQEGIGTNVLISEYEIDRVHEFLSDPQHWRVGHRPCLPSPSDVVVSDLIHRGVWA